MATDTEQETQTWWRADKIGAPRITAFEVVRVTAMTVTHLEPGARLPRRSHIDTSWDRWFPTEAEAVAFSRDRLAERVRTLRASLEHAFSALAAFNEAHPLTVDEV